ncbi:MAG: CpXC domain-containing protein [Treponema sp.]|jgi:hypothetical protein|nr:CpXC domain-containing protein [Treponema sp.]
MKQKIPCFCDKSFFVEFPEELDLDAEPSFIDEMLDGSFMNFTCPACGKLHKPEFPITVLWPSKKLRLEVLPELDRGLFYRRQENPEDTETVIGFPEMIERIAVIRDGLEPLAVEVLKYFLLLKADESYPGKEPVISYDNSSAAGLEFHISGIREGEYGISRIPVEVYEKTCKDYRMHPKAELYRGLRVKTYLSVQNTIRPDLPGQFKTED